MAFFFSFIDPQKVYKRKKGDGVKIRHRTCTTFAENLLCQTTTSTTATTGTKTAAETTSKKSKIRFCFGKL